LFCGRGHLQTRETREIKGNRENKGKQGKSRETGEIKGNRGIQGEIRNPGETRVSL
jgi:hypothetical protein